MSFAGLLGGAFPGSGGAISADKLIAILNDMDGDPDLEDGADDEPSLGAHEGHASQIVWLRGSDTDHEITTQENRA